MQTHTLIGQTLQRQTDQTHAVLDARFLANLAFHFARSNEHELGAFYSQQADASALRSFASEEALTHYRTALGLLDEQVPQYGVCLLGEGEAALVSGLSQDAIKAFASALDWWRARGKSEEAGRAALGLGRAYLRRAILLQSGGICRHRRNCCEMRLPAPEHWNLAPLSGAWEHLASFWLLPGNARRR